MITFGLGRGKWAMLVFGFGRFGGDFRFGIGLNTVDNDFDGVYCPGRGELARLGGM